MRRIIAIAASLLFFAIACVLIPRIPESGSIEIDYTGPHRNIYHKEFAGVCLDISSADSFSVESRAFKRHATLHTPADAKCGNIYLRLSSSSKPVAIERIYVRCGACETLSIPADYLPSPQHMFNVASSQIENDALVITPTSDGGAGFVLYDALSVMIAGALRNSAPSRRLMMALAAVLALLVYALVYTCIAKNGAPLNLRITHAICGALLIAALGCVFAVSALSDIGGHPDEDVTRLAIEHYETHSGLPDFASPDVQKTFSNYGTTRLRERTPYYVLAGKVSSIVRSATGAACPFRAFNALLLTILIAFFILRGMRHPWIAPVLVFSPQFWYIFSYATSDAWDFTVALALVTWFVVKCRDYGEESIDWFELAIPGVLAGLVFLGKPNYFLSFGIVAGVMLETLMLVERPARIRIVKSCAIAAAVAIAVVALRYGVEFLHYHGHRAAEYLAASAGKNDHYYKAGRNMQHGGKTVYDIMVTKFLGITWQSFSGTYGWMSIFSSPAFLRVFGWTLGASSFALAFAAIRRRVSTGTWRTIILVGAVVLALGASAWNSWNADFQAQGRYLFPAMLALVPLARNAGDSILARVAPIALAAVSIFGFFTFGTMNLVP